MKQKGLCAFHLSLLSAKVRWRGQRLQLELLALTIQPTSNPVHVFLRKKVLGSNMCTTCTTCLVFLFLVVTILLFFASLALACSNRH